MSNEKQETIADIVAEMRMGSPVNPGAYRIGLPDKITVLECGVEMRTIQIKTVTVKELADRIEAAWKREREEIVNEVSVLRDGLCLHCDLQQQCAEGEDGMPTTCNAMAKVNNFIDRYNEYEVSDECPF